MQSARARGAATPMRRLRNRYFLLSDLVLVPVAAYAAFVLRLDTVRLAGWWAAVGLFAAGALVGAPFLFYACGLYRRYWQYASIEELPRLAGAVALLDVLDVLAFMALQAWWPAPGVVLPRTVPAIFFLLALAVVAGPRLAVRLIAAALRPRNAPDRPQPTLIIGAGGAGTMTAIELKRNPHLGLQVVGFLDDDPAKQRMHVRGVPVLGTRADLPRVIRLQAIERVIIAMPTAPGAVIREVVRSCEQAHITPQVVPGLYELIGGQVHVSQLRNVEIDDLLRREPLSTDLAGVAQLVRDQRVLVTGAGGSIGAELCRQVLRCQPAELILLGHGEHSIFAIQQELQHLLDGGRIPQATKVHAVIADIRSAGRIQQVFTAYQPQLVFHAAAHKHVPLMEDNPAEAVTTNVLGTRVVLEAAQRVGVARFVFVSTDKAVNPTSVMGATKRAAELLVHQVAAATGQPYLAVRFGNVLGSRGSVVVTMKQQIARGGPVTVTHPDMQRYFMTIPEAVQLILQAALLGRGREVFVFDMGEPVRILDLAHDLIRLSGLEVGADIEIVYTGVRPGEKLFEELFLPGERYERTRHDKIFIAANASRALPADLRQLVAALEAAAQRGDTAAIGGALRRLVPEYQPGRQPVVAASATAGASRRAQPLAAGEATRELRPAAGLAGSE